MRRRVTLLTCLVAAACGFAFWATLRIKSSGAPRPEATSPSDSTSFQVTRDDVGAEDPADEGRRRREYDTLVRQVFECLNRGDVGQLIRELARGESLDDIIDQDLRGVVSAKLRETTAKYEESVKLEKQQLELVVQNKIDAGNYEVGVKVPTRRSGKAPMTLCSRTLPSGQKAWISIGRGEAPEYEKARDTVSDIIQNRERQITQIFGERGLRASLPSQ